MLQLMQISAIFLFCEVMIFSPFCLSFHVFLLSSFLHCHVISFFSDSRPPLSHHSSFHFVSFHFHFFHPFHSFLPSFLLSVISFLPPRHVFFFRSLLYSFHFIFFSSYSYNTLHFCLSPPSLLLFFLPLFYFPLTILPSFLLTFHFPSFLWLPTFLPSICFIPSFLPTFHFFPSFLLPT